MVMAYSDFLDSDEWRELRQAALTRANGLCDYCGESAAHVHHVRYPKVGQPHTLDMLVAVCVRCHDLSHGARDMEPLKNAQRTEVTGPFDNTIAVYHSDGLIWASIAQWCKVLQAPYFMPDYFEKFAEVRAASMKGGPFVAACTGVRVFRWPPIAATLDKWHRNWMEAVVRGDLPKETNKRRESERFAKNILQLKEWGYSLQEREIQHLMQSRMTPEQAATGTVEVDQAMQAIQSLAQATHVTFTKQGESIEQHEGRINELEKTSPVYRDPEAFVTVKQRLLELGLPFGILIVGRRNLANVCGDALERSSATRGSKQRERADGNGLTFEVGTWRRVDIDKAIKEYVPDMQSPSSRQESFDF